MGVLPGLDRQVTVCDEGGAQVADHLAGCHGHVTVGLDLYRLPGDAGADSGGSVQGVAGGGGPFAEGASAGVLVGFVNLYPALSCAQADVASGLQVDLSLAAVEFRRPGLQVLASQQGEAALGLDPAACVAAAAVLSPVGSVPDDAVATALGHGAKLEVVTRHQYRTARDTGIGYFGCRQGQVAPGLRDQGAIAPGDVQASHAVDMGAVSLGVALAARGGGDVEVAPSHGAEAVAGINAPTQVVEVGAGLNADVLSGHAPQVVEVLGMEGKHLAPGHRAAVDQVATDVEVDTLPRYQRSLAIEIPVLYPNINLRNQGLGLASVRQGNGLLLQPYNVTGQRCHLRSTEANARYQLMCLGKGNGVVH